MNTNPDSNLGLMLAAIRKAGEFEGVVRLAKGEASPAMVAFTELMDRTVMEIDVNSDVLRSNAWVTRRLNELNKAMQAT